MKKKSVHLPIYLVVSMVLTLAVLLQSSTAVFADHTTPPTSVTLAGDLQSELGCPGDWEPGCATTHLAEQGNQVWRGEFTVPTGDWPGPKRVSAS